MKVGDILREAAALIENGDEEFSCLAVCRAAHIRSHTEVLYAHPAGSAYADFFGGSFPRVIEMYRDIDGEADSSSRELAEAHRVLALCMAATLADDAHALCSLPVREKT